MTFVAIGALWVKVCSKFRLNIGTLKLSGQLFFGHHVSVGSVGKISPPRKFSDAETFVSMVYDLKTEAK